MQHLFGSALVAAILSVPGSVAMAQQVPGGQPVDPQAVDVPAALEQFRDMNPDTRLNWRWGRIARVYGPSFGGGDTPLEAANSFIETHAGIFGVAPTDLSTRSPFPDGDHVTPFGWDLDTQTNRFSLVAWTQEIDGIPVFRSDLRLVVRNEPGHPVVLASTELKDLSAHRGSFAGAAIAPSALDENVYLAFAGNQFAGPPEVSGLRQVVWAGYEGETPEAPILAVEFIAEGTPAFQRDGVAKHLYVVDAQTGAILFQENQIFHADGRVSARATQGSGADICEDEAITPMPYARVDYPGGTVYADADGFFDAPTTADVTASIEGLYFEVVNNDGSPIQTQTLPGTSFADFVLNDANANELDRAEVNAYYHSNVVRDYVLQYNPTYPTIASQLGFRINTNIGSNCNAFYNGSSINFYTSGGGCSNTAFSSVVHHEYGHHLVNRAGSGQGAFGEGFGDVCGVLILDESELAIGFQNNCGSGIRNANNTQQPCSSPIHQCGTALSGSVWDVRQALIANGVSEYRDLLGTWMFNSVLLHGPTTVIDENITIDVLTIDDDDDNILNGTPYYAEIDEGFSLHSMPAPELQLLAISLVDAPQFSTPSGSTVRVRIEDLVEGYQPDTARLRSRVDGTGSFSATTLVPLGGDEFEAQLPAADCGSTIEFYVTVRTDSNTTFEFPQGAPLQTINLQVATSFELIEEDDFNSELTDWTVSGNIFDAASGRWERGIPAAGDRGDPPADFDGSGQCWVTGNFAGNSDVDDGQTILTSGRFSTVGGDVFITYSRWFDNTRGNSPEQDVFRVEISGDNGGSWTLLEEVGPAGAEVAGGWFTRTFLASEFIEPSSQTRIRFIAEDADPGSVVEAAIDGFRVELVECSDAVVGDVNGDGVVNGSDLSLVLGAWGSGDEAADLDGDGVVTGSDLAIVLANWS